MIKDYRLVWVVVRLTIFYWILFTAISLSKSPVGFVEGFTQWLSSTQQKLLLIVLISAVMLVYMWVRLMLNRARLRKNTEPAKWLNMESTKGKLPIKTLLHIDPDAPLKPLKGKYIQDWITAQQKIAENSGKKSEYVALFYAIWRIYSQYALFPASHRTGGHGNRRLFLHCHDVSEHCLRLIDSGWEYKGVFVKKRGRNPVKIHSPSSSKAVLSPHDPLIPLVGLAHDLGKLLCYEIDKEGNIIKNIEGDASTLDDDNDAVLHDFLAPRVLSMLPEYWALNTRDRESLTLAVSFYHHPSAFSLKSNGMLKDERGAMLMSLLIDADKQVSASESGFDFREEMDEDDSQAIYSAFVEILTTYGRINGTGAPVADRQNMIGQKYSDYIVIREKRLRTLMLKRLNLTEDGGERRYDFTIRLLTVLKERGLLYTKHGDVDFMEYLPMYKVSLYHHKRKKHMITFAPAIVIKVPDASMVEFESLGFLDIHNSIPVFESVMTTHLKSIKNPDVLAEMNQKAFGSNEGLFSNDEDEEEEQEQEIGQTGTSAEDTEGDDESNNSVETEQSPRPLHVVEDTEQEKSADASGGVADLRSQIAMLEQGMPEPQITIDTKPVEEVDTASIAAQIFGLNSEGVVVRKKPRPAKVPEFNPVPELDENDADYQAVESKVVKRRKPEENTQATQKEIAKGIFKL